MSISKESELVGMRKVSEAVAVTLKKMRAYAQPHMTTQELDEYGGKILREFGAKSAPKLTYGFPGWTCICINEQVAHGLPSKEKLLQEGDLINIDVSAELNGFWADNGGSFVLGEDIHQHQPLVNASQEVLRKAISKIKHNVKIADLGHLIKTEARKRGFTVIRNLAGHGVGRSLHEEPHDILNYRDRFNRTRFKRNSVVAIETFISTRSNRAKESGDGWTLVGNKGGYVAQHEHTIIVTDAKPIILTAANDIFIV